MSSSSEQSIADMTLTQKLACIRVASDVVKKEKKGYNYNYASITTILANITGGMKKYRVSLYPCIVPNTMNTETLVYEKTKFSKNGEQYIDRSQEIMVTSEMVFTWVNDDNPEDFLKIPWILVGSQSDPAQAMGSGLTYTLRQFLTSFFQIAQEDSDVDAFRTKQKEAEHAEDREIASKIVHEIDVMIKTYLSDHPESTEAVKKFNSRYIKSANYLNIKEPAIAAKLLSDFKGTFLGENSAE